MIQISNGKMQLGRHKKFKMRSNEKCERSHEKTVMHGKRDQSQIVAAHENLPEIKLLQAQVTSQKNARALKMHSPQPGCYGHVISEIQLVRQPVLLMDIHCLLSETVT